MQPCLDSRGFPDSPCLDLMASHYSQDS